MISIYREHTDKVNRERIKNYIEQGVRCQYTYTHYAPSGKPTDEVRDIAKKDALNMLAERCEKTLSREDGYRFSPSRCFLYGYVRGGLYRNVRGKGETELLEDPKDFVIANQKTERK